MQRFHLLAKRVRERVPDRVLRYGAAVVGLAAVTAIAWLLVRFHAPRSLVVSGALWLAFSFSLLGAAWLGYGPGLLVCALAMFGVVPLLGAGRANFNPLARFVALSALSVLVSRVAHSERARREALRRAAAELEDRVRQRTAEAVAAERAAREQAQLLELAHDAILALDRDHTIRYWSQGAERMYGWSKDDAVGKVSFELLHTVFPEPLEEIERQLAASGHWEGELRHTRRDGAPLVIASRWALRHGPDGRRAGYLEINSDITERRRIDEQLRHTQKLESLGLLAGGVAHDFNNLLTGILGNASLALDDTPPGHPNRPLLTEVIRASERAADLTRQLLAYAGKGRFVIRPIDLSDLVREISALVRTSLPKSVEVRMELAEGLPAVEADAGQLQQIVMNLVINGAEAIVGENGAVMVRTAAREIDGDFSTALSPDGERLRPGRYVSLEVSDSGSGMDPDTAARIFDPFFTTKFTGRGLGLSAVQGIVRSHGGGIRVDSRPGQGTTVEILLPANGHPAVAPPAATEPPSPGRGTILIVDDEELVRDTAGNALERYGYRTVPAADGAEAVALFRANPEAIDVVLLDLTMPVMGGEETLRQLRAIRPSVSVVLTSGYSETEAVERFADLGLAGFIQKPYTGAALASKINEALEA